MENITDNILDLWSIEPKHHNDIVDWVSAKHRPMTGSRPGSWFSFHELFYVASAMKLLPYSVGNFIDDILSLFMTLVASKNQQL